MTNRLLAAGLLALACAASTCAGAAAATAPRHPHARLVAYVRHVSVEIRRYRSVLARVEDALNPDEPDVAAIVEALRGVSGDFDRLARRWSRIRAPRRLRFHHHRVRVAFELQRDAYSLLADAWEEAGATGDPAPVLKALEEIAPSLARAGHVQKQWAATLRGALRRAHLRVPRWLTELARGDDLRS